MSEKPAEHPEYRKGTPEWRISVIKNIFAETPSNDSNLLSSTDKDEVSITRHTEGYGYAVYILKNTNNSVFFKRILIWINKQGEVTEVEDTAGDKVSTSKKKRYTAMLDDELEKSTTHLTSGIEMETGHLEEDDTEDQERSGIISKIRRKLKL